MANVRVKDKTAITGASVDAADVFFITDTSVDTDKKIVASELKAYILDAKTLGGSAAGDVTTNNGTQTLTGKTLTSPKVNEAVAVTAKATEINKLTGCTATTAELNLTHTYAAKIPYLANVTSDIQAQINGLTVDPLYLVHCYGLTFTATAASKVLTEDAILTALGLSTSAYYIDASSIHGTTCTVDAGKYTVLDDTGVTAPNVAISWTTQTDSGTLHLTQLTATGLTYTPVASAYNIAFTFKLIAIPGA